MNNLIHDIDIIFRNKMIKPINITQEKGVADDLVSALSDEINGELNKMINEHFEMQNLLQQYESDF